MAIQIFIQERSATDTGEAGYYVTGVAGAPCMLWVRQQGQWVHDVENLPEKATALSLADVPTDLQEELLALAARAEVLGPQGWNLNRG